MGRILALDVGEKRIGVAITDALNIIAQGLEVIKQKNPDETLSRIMDIVKKNNVSKVIVGMPFNMDGSKGSAAQNIQGFVEFLKKNLTIDVETIDERLTTAQGERILLDADISRKKRKLSIDKIAAQLILQTYLDLHV